MDTANLAAVRRPELVTDHEGPSAPEAVRHLTVLVVYELSETGRKASLLAGGDGRALQQLNVQMPANRLHLVAVDARGTARLKLRPRFEMDAEQRVVRKNTAPVYDAPPTLETLIHEAARNHQLERVYNAERNLARLKRREAEQARRTQIAETFLADKSQRALVHPTPSPVRCSLATGQGRMLFDVATDVGVARNVPAEALRRFRADLAARKEQNLRERAVHLARHEEKKRFVAEWMAQHGTPDQRERLAAGMLRMNEAIEAITDHVLAPLADWPRYPNDALERLAERHRVAVADVGVEVSPRNLAVGDSNITSADAAQWAMMQAFRAQVPNATVTVRRHRLFVRGRPDIPPVVIPGMLLTVSLGPLALRREYEVRRYADDRA